MWRLLLGNAVYYLYAEDYVSGIEYVKKTFDEYLGSDKWEFVAPQDMLASESVGHTDEFMSYAITSGYDLVFLVKTLENTDDAHFAKYSKL